MTRSQDETVNLLVGPMCSWLRCWFNTAINNMKDCMCMAREVQTKTNKQPGAQTQITSSKYRKHFKLSSAPAGSVTFQRSQNLGCFPSKGRGCDTWQGPWSWPLMWSNLRISISDSDSDSNDSGHRNRTPYHPQTTGRQLSLSLNSLSLSLSNGRVMAATGSLSRLGSGSAQAYMLGSVWLVTG